MSAPLIVRTSLHTLISSQLRMLIDQGELKPGTHLNEVELCAQLGVSRTPFREALRSLASEGLIELQPNRGAMVSVITRKLLAEILPIMAALEGLAGRLASQMMTNSEVAAVQDVHTRMIMHYHTDDVTSYFKDNEIIHEMITQGSKNQTLIHSINTLSAQVRLARFSAQMTPKRWAQAVDEHEAIINALKARDGDGIEDKLRQHVRTKGDTIIEAMQQPLVEF